MPPGQYVTTDFPVLSAGPTPRVALDEWTFSIRGEVDEPRSWTWNELQALPREDITVDIHCVTKWSKLDTDWAGVSIDTLLDGVDTAAEHVLAYCDGGYTTNLPLEDVTGGKAWIAFGYDGEPLDPEHGGPARLLVPHLYFWKSAKWVRGIELRLDDQPGFWESSATTTTAIRGASSATPAIELAARHRRRAAGRDRPDGQHRARRARVAGAPGRPARRRAADRRGRLPGAAQLLDRLGTGGRAPGADGRAAGRRRGVLVPGRRAARRATSWSCAGRSAATSSGRRRSAGRCCWWPAAPGSCR